MLRTSVHDTVCPGLVYRFDLIGGQDKISAASEVEPWGELGAEVMNWSIWKEWVDFFQRMMVSP